MRHRRRLDKLRDRARQTRTERAWAIRSRVCVGLDPEQVLGLVMAAVRSEHRPIIEAIDRQTEDYHARGRRRPDGSPPAHGFLDWLCGLNDGRWSLPEELPEAWLAAWRDGYVPEWGVREVPLVPAPVRAVQGLPAGPPVR